MVGVKQMAQHYRKLEPAQTALFQLFPQRRRCQGGGFVNMIIDNELAGG